MNKENERASDIRLEIRRLQEEARSEMISQNMGGSLTRCYAAADRMYERIRELDEELRMIEE